MLPSLCRKPPIRLAKCNNSADEKGHHTLTAFYSNIIVPHIALPARLGSGVRAGGPVRAVVKLAELRTSLAS